MRKVNILLVDDHPDNLLALEAVLESLGENLVKALSGEEALRCLLDQDFAVILLDVQMHGMSGFEIATLIKERERSRHTPIIFLTGVITDDSKAFQGYSVGAVDYLVKPIMPEVLKAKVAVFIELFRKTDELAQQLHEIRQLNRDIHEHRQTQEILREQREWLRITLASIGDAVIATDMDGHISLINTTAEALTGWSQKEAEGRPIQEIFQVISEANHLPVENPLLKVLSNGVPIGLENGTLLITRNGSEIPIDDRATPIYDADQNILGAVLVFRDITEQKRAEAALAEERNLLRTLIDNAPDYIYVRDTESRFIINNNEHRRIMGASSLEEIIGKTDFDFFPPDLASRYHSDDMAVIQSGEALVNREEPTTDPTGRKEWVLTTKVPLRDRQGRVVGIVGISRDITDRKRVEEALRTSEEQLRLAVEAANMGTWDWDVPTGQIHYTGHLSDLFGQTSDGFDETYEALLAMVHPDDRLTLRQAVTRTLEEGASYNVEFRIVQPGGNVRWLVEQGQAYHDETGKVVHIRGIVQDITERKLAEQERARLLQEAQEAIRARDQFLSVAAHELKTPVTSMRGFSQAILRQIDKGDIPDLNRVKQVLQRIDQQSDKLGRLIGQLLDISRITGGRLKLDLQETELVGMVKDVISSIRVNSDHHAITVRGLSSITVSADPLRLEQVVTNLLDNAIKYSPDGGLIDVEICEEMTQPGSGEAQVRITDHGIGIAPEFREQIFRPFFQAHSGEHFGGMGLGLYVSREIVQLHSGRLEAEFPDEGGTRFIVTLPVKAN